MFREEIEDVGISAKKKVNLLNSNPLGYFLLSMLAGAYVGISSVFIFSIGGLLRDFPGNKIVMGASFGIALSLVAVAGAELFTGNNFVMVIGAVRKKIKWSDAIKLWIVCYLGNLVGSLLMAYLFYLGGYINEGPIAEFIVKSVYSKVSLKPLELLIRGLLCNFLVCLATWCGYRTKSETAKLIMIFWCLFAFITTGFEHSIANMTTLSVGLLSPIGSELTVSNFIYNLSLSTIGNMIGGIIFLALPYIVVSKEEAN